MTRLEKQIRRRIAHPTRLAGELVIEVGPGGLSFRPPRSRTRLAVSWRDVYLLAERRAGELAHQEKLRERAIARGAR